MSDNEYERFEITDYDLDNEFNPNRNRRRPTKNQQIYGIWADSDSDNDTSDKFTTKGRRGGKKSKDYTAPVNFVAGGVQQYGKKDEKKSKSSPEVSDEADELRPRFGAIEGDGSNSSESDCEVEAKPKISSTAGFRQMPNKNKLSGNLGTWEAHTKGIGAKLLLQMGYKPGKGLGKSLQGIATPVQAAVRKGRGAIGAYGPELKQTLADQKAGAKKIDEDEKETIEFKEKLQQLRGESYSSSKGKRQRYYKSIQDVIEKGKKPGYVLQERANSKLANVTVIDMTGPEKRVLSGYHALGQTKIAEESLYEHRPTKKCTNFALPELMHNLNLIVDMCEQEIILIDKTQRSNKDRQVVLEQEKDNFCKIVELEKNHILTLELALELVNKLTNTANPIDIEEAEDIFIELQANYPSEYKEFGLGDLAPGIIAPLFNAKLLEWNALQEPTRHVELLKKWKTILGMNQSSTVNIFDPYSALVWLGIIPSFRRAATLWDPRSHQSMAALLDTWAPLLPNNVLDNVLEQIILPRIHTSVIEWDPLTDTIPIHVWIHPWKGLLDHKMDETVYPLIRDKLGHALKTWTPSDRSARAMITPWKNVFANGDMQAFLIKHVIPKLQMTLSELIINPLQQDLELWNQVWEWHEVIPVLNMTQLLDKFFFPKWIQTLVIWLNQAPNFDQVSRWYSGWKGLFSDDILQQVTIKEHFRRALELMHRSTGAVAILAVDTQSVVITPQASSMLDMQMQALPALEFKELVSQKCAERGIIFAPMPGRRETGKQVYRVGKLFCYIDRSVIMLSDGSLSNWQPVPLTLLLEKAITG